MNWHKSRIKHLCCLKWKWAIDPIVTYKRQFQMGKWLFPFSFDQRHIINRPVRINPSENIERNGIRSEDDGKERKIAPNAIVEMRCGRKSTCPFSFTSTTSFRSWVKKIFSCFDYLLRLALSSRQSCTSVSTDSSVPTIPSYHPTRRILCGRLHRSEIKNDSDQLLQPHPRQ